MGVYISTELKFKPFRNLGNSQDIDFSVNHQFKKRKRLEDKIYEILAMKTMLLELFDATLSIHGNFASILKDNFIFLQLRYPHFEFHLRNKIF